MPEISETLAAIEEALAIASEDVEFENIETTYLVRAAATCQTS